MGNQTQRPSGRAGIAGKRGGMQILIAGVQKLDVRPFSSGELVNFGAKFSSAKNKVKQQWLITGITKDSTGAVLGNCTVTLFKTVDNMPCCITTSDANGNYSFSIDGNSQVRFAVSYKAGSPDVTGATVNTLVPVLT